jgi:hypothetical protein
VRDPAYIIETGNDSWRFKARMHKTSDLSLQAGMESVARSRVYLD